MIVPTMTSALLESVDAERSGIASGVLNSARQTGSVIGVALFGSFAANDAVGGVHVSLFITVGLAVAVCVAALTVTSRATASG